MGEYGRHISEKSVTVTVDLWDWSSGSIRDTIDITKDITAFRFTKSLKSPGGSATISVLPQSASTHILNLLSVMDVVKIREFGVTKFIGYITRIGFSGSIGNDGKPSREATILMSHIGGLLNTAAVGLGLGPALGQQVDTLKTYAIRLAKAIGDSVADGASYTDTIKVAYSNFISLLYGLSSKNFAYYLSSYMDAEIGLISTSVPVIPREFDLYKGEEKSLTFWSIIERLVQAPFNELWVDNGPRSVFIDGKTIEFDNDKAYLISRESPFNGSVHNGVALKSFDNMGSGVFVDKDHLTRFDLSKSMDEVYTTYSVIPSVYSLSEIHRVAVGQYSVDEERIGRYLLKPLIVELFFSKNMDKITPNVAATSMKDMSDTLLNWFKNNDIYLSGIISLMVPEENKNDPKIGDKLRVYGINGYFYVDSISHTWTYGGALYSNVTVTRGYDYSSDKAIELKDAIFNRRYDYSFDNAYVTFNRGGRL